MRVTHNDQWGWISEATSYSLPIYWTTRPSKASFWKIIRPASRRTVCDCLLLDPSSPSEMRDVSTSVRSWHRPMEHARAPCPELTQSGHHDRPELMSAF